MKPKATPVSERRTTMKKLNVTKERFEKSRYFQKKYGKLEYVSESGKLFKTNKGKILKFKESMDEPKYSIGDTVYIYNQEWIVEKVKFSERIGEFVYDLYTDDGGHTIGIPENHLSDTPSKPPRRPRNRKFNESGKKFGKKFTKESIDTDPALVCPYCGGNNCEVSIGTDDLNFTNLDRLQGETFNVECWCNDCDKPYNVTLELNVKDVYPNEDYNNL